MSFAPYVARCCGADRHTHPETIVARMWRDTCERWTTLCERFFSIRFSAHLPLPIPAPWVGCRGITPGCRMFPQQQNLCAMLKPDGIAESCLTAIATDSSQAC